MSSPLMDLLGELSERTSLKFEKQPKVIAKDDSFAVESLPVDAAEWHSIEDVVCVYFDLKSSTNLAKGRTPASTASIYDAGVGGVVKILRKLGADFVDIQGDGGFGLFWGAGRYERAMTAAITIRSFSSDFTSQLESKWENAPTTGFKIGVSSGPIMAKVVGLPRQKDYQEPVWAGRPVNYAAKAAQQTTPEELVVTGSVWDSIRDNDFLMFTCGCPDASEPAVIWRAVTLDKIPDGDRYGQGLQSYWCPIHGEEFCNAVLKGRKHRDEVRESSRSALNLIGYGTEELLDASKLRKLERDESKAVLAKLSRE